MSHTNNVQKKAIQLRKEMTPQERTLWEILRNNKFYGLKFRRQVPFGKYIVDFLCESKKIIVELDGGQHNEPDKITYDNNRTKFFDTYGYKIIRFWNNEIDNNIEGVYEKLKETMNIKD